MHICTAQTELYRTTYNNWTDHSRLNPHDKIEKLFLSINISSTTMCNQVWKCKKSAFWKHVLDHLRYEYVDVNLILKDFYSNLSRQRYGKYVYKFYTNLRVNPFWKQVIDRLRYEYVEVNLILKDFF